MPTYRDEAVVLRTHQLGEADRIISLFTRTHGKVRAVARGVRRSSSKFGSRLEPFGHVDLQLAVGRGALDVVAQVETLHPPLLGNDYQRFTAAEVLVEAADKLVTEDRSPAVPQYRLLLGALLALRDENRNPTQVVDAYLLRGMAIAGYAVVLAECAGCGKPEVGWFSAAGGGAVCANCRPPGSDPLSPEVATQLASLLAGEWDRVIDEPNVTRRAHSLTIGFATWHLDRSLRSLPFLITDVSA